MLFWRASRSRAVATQRNSNVSCRYSIAPTSHCVVPCKRDCLKRLYKSNQSIWNVKLRHHVLISSRLSCQTLQLHMEARSYPCVIRNRTCENSCQPPEHSMIVSLHLMQCWGIFEKLQHPSPSVCVSRPSSTCCAQKAKGPTKQFPRCYVKCACETSQ